MKLLISVILLLVLLCDDVVATDMVFRHYTIEDGLPNSNVFRLLQDKRGFMWVGTESGLCKFNGQEFEKFDYYRPLQGKQILGLFETDAGEVLINSYDSRIHIYNRDQGFREFLPADGFLNAACTEILEDGQENIWVIQRPYLNMIDKNKAHDFFLSTHFSRFTPGSRKPEINDITASAEGGVYISSDDGLFYYLNGDVLEIEGSEGFAVHSVQTLGPRTLLLGCLGSVLLVEDHKVVKKIVHKSFTNRKLQEVVRQKQDRYWIAGEGFGPFLMNLELAELKETAKGKLAAQDGKIRGLPELAARVDTSMQFEKVQVNDILVDRRGETWFATFGSGVIFLSGKSINNLSVEDGLTSGYVEELVEYPRGKILAASIHGLSEVDLVQNTLRRVPLNLAGEAPKSVDWIESMTLDSAQRLWVGLKPNRVVAFDGTTSLLNTYGAFFDEKVKKSFYGTTAELEAIGRPSQLANPPLLLYTDRDGTVIGVFWKGIFKFVDSSPEELLGNTPITDQRVFSINRDADGGLWVGTDIGLFYSTDEVTASRFGYDDGLPNENIRAIAFDDEARVWVATDLGAAVYDGSAWTVYDEQNGLTSNLCTSLAKDLNGAMWVGTKNGLNCIVNGKITHVNRRRGIVSDEVLSLLIDSEQYLWLGTGAGVSRIVPNQFSTGERAAPSTYITSILTQFDTLRIPQHVVLPYDSSDVTINYAALEYEFPEGVQFQYKLENADEDWRISSEWSKNYTNLSPGEYVFRVRSRIDNSAWDEMRTSFQLTITPPIWQQLEYQLLALLVGMIFAGGIVLAYTRSRQARRDEKNSWMLSIAELQQQALNLTVNPHFLFNALTSIQHYFNSDQTISRANIYLSKFSKLVRLVLDDSQYDQISLSDELHRLGLYFELEKMRLGKNFEWFVTTDLTHDAEEVKIPVMIIQPYVENAIWHGIYPLNGEGEVRVHIWNESEDLLRVRISDNGLGVAQSRQVKNVNGRTHKSRGMQITQQRIDLHVRTGKGKIAVDISELDPDNTERPGTVVDISVGI